MEYRVGIGYDIHRLVEGRKLYLGAVEIPYIKGLFGHSDADVLLHAIIDALLGAMGKNDIGDYFPDTDPKYHNIASEKLLKEVNDLLKKEKFLISNIDTVVIAQQPALSPFKKQIQESIARVLQIPSSKVGVKAKTNEGLGELGSSQAIAAYASVIITREA